MSRRGRTPHRLPEAAGPGGSGRGRTPLGLSGGALLAALTALLLLLTGCTGLPRDSEVEPRLTVDNADQRPAIVVEPEPPGADAGPEEIAAGFIRAHNGVPEGFATARQYLAGTALDGWSPDQGILLLSSSNLSARRIAGGRVVVTAVAEAQVDPEGHVTQLPTEERRTLQLGVSQVAGGAWRVTSVPDDLGLWLSVADFERLYQPKRVYFASQNGPKVLLPDVRWFPEAGMTTALARAVIGAPPTWLTGVVRNRLPAGTRLQPNAVPVSATDRTATVTLSREALGASPLDREALWAAMLQTLSQAPGVSRVQLMVGSARLEAPGMGPDSSVEDLDYSVVPAPSGPVIVRKDAKLVWNNNDNDSRRPAPTPTDREPLPTIPSQWYQLAGDSRGREIAAIAGDRKTLGRWIAGKLTSRPSFGTQLVRPAYDGQNDLWVAGQALTAAGPGQSGGRPAAENPTTGPPTIWVIDTRQPVQQAQPQPVTAPWLGQRDVVALAVSPESARLALVVRDRSTRRTSLLLSGIVRDSSGEVDSLGTPVVVNPAISDLSSVTWADETTLGVLGRMPSSPERVEPIMVPLSGLAQPLGPAPGATAVVGSSIPQDRVFVVTDRGTVLAREGRSWEVFDQGDDVVAPAP